MTSPNSDLVIRARLVDELSRPLGQVRREFASTATATNEAGSAAGRTASDYDRMRVAAARAGDAVGTGLSRVLVAQHQHAGVLSGSIGRLVSGYAALQVGQAAYNSVASTQDAQASFEGLVGSQKQALDLTRQLQAMKTPFATSGLLGGAQDLLTFGAQASTVLPTLQALSDAVAGTGGNTSKLTAAAQAFAELRQNTFLTSGALAQLQSQGLPAADLLAKAHGMDQFTLKRALDSGALRISGQQGADELLAAFETQYKGKAAQAGKTLRGATSELGNEAAKSLYDAISPELPQITAFMHSMAGDLPLLAHAASPFLKVLGTTLGVMADHPHLTEALAGFLIFREIAGPTIRTATALYDMGKALQSIKSSEEVLLLLRNVGGLPGGMPGVPGYRPAAGTPPIVVPPGSKSGGVVSEAEAAAAAVGTAAVAGARFGTRVGRGIVHVGRFAEHTFGGNPDVFDRSNARVASRDTGLAAQVDAAQRDIQSRTGFTAADIGRKGAASLTPSERALLMGRSAFGNAHPGVVGGRVDFDAKSAQRALQTYAAADSAARAQASSLLGGVQINVHGATVDEIMRQLTPQLRTQLKAALDADRQQSAARKRIAVP